MTKFQVIMGVQIGMTLSFLAFISAFYYRKKNTIIHKYLGIAGTLFNILASIFLVVTVRVIGVTVVSDYPAYIMNIHRALATAVVILMLLMAYWGITKNRKMHIRFHKIFLISYTIIYISGWILFL